MFAEIVCSVWVLCPLGGGEGPFLVVFIQRKNICPCLVSVCEFVALLTILARKALLAFHVNYQ